MILLIGGYLQLPSSTYVCLPASCYIMLWAACSSYHPHITGGLPILYTLGATIPTSISVRRIKRDLGGMTLHIPDAR